MKKEGMLLIICCLVVIGVSIELLLLFKVDKKNCTHIIETGKCITLTPKIITAANKGPLSAKISQTIKSSNKRIEVDISKQKLKLFENNTQVAEYRISSGTLTHPTPLGEFKIYNKFDMAYSQKYKCWLPFWMAFTQDGLYGFHGLPICGNEKIGKTPLGRPSSHGCIRLDDNDAKEIYNWTSIGTKIIISGEINELTQDWCYNFNQDLWQGKKGNDVEALQAILNIPTNGIFDPVTKASTIKFQIAQGLIGNGIVGPLTRAKLNELYGCAN
jgi:peptidoglycan hydrolase-like protein with peptidoglycan-binding domain